jgi:anti-sigma B factor antagonist
MEIKNSRQNRAVIVTLGGRMDAATAPDFEKQCAALIQAGEKLLVIDMAGLAYISSAGLRSILAAAKTLKAQQGDIRFCNLQGMVSEVFSISGFSSMFAIHETLDRALADT